VLITYRFLHYPGTFVRSLTHPLESLFYPTFWLSIATLITNLGKYAVPSTGSWLKKTFEILFWIYFIATYLSAALQYYSIFDRNLLKDPDANPAWDLPIFPVMLSGIIASVGLGFEPTLATQMSMFIAGLVSQGLGLIFSIFIFTIYLRRLILHGHLPQGSRPVMFMSVGPPSVVVVTILDLAKNYPQQPGASYFGNVQSTRQICLVLATITGIFVWSLSLWFFFISLLANMVVWRQAKFHYKFKLNWWYIFLPPLTIG
jgi:tellurite resistance protein TehA-like permease